MDEKLNISVNLNGKKFNLQIKNSEQEEMIYRNAADMFNETVQNYKLEQYEGIEEKDILSMVAYNYVIKYLRSDISQNKDNKDFLLTLQEINHSLDTYLE